MTSPSIREIPYNYTSLSDQEIVHRFLGDAMWDIINDLRQARKTGRSARLFLEILGDMWVVQRNPYIQEDLINDKSRWQSLLQTLNTRLDLIRTRADNNPLVDKLIAATQQAVAKFAHDLTAVIKLRMKIRRTLSKVSHPDNIDFSPFSRASHVTDASDWRVEYPLLVIHPDKEEELAPLVRACIKLGLTIIPRGGGTGYTGGAVPLFADTAIINMEKLDRLEGIKTEKIPGVDPAIPTVRAQAGVVTKRISELAYAHHLVFAVDPTSQDASTIGGNIAMNAGGKKAVIWGTTLDNLVSWRLVTPTGEWLEVTRLNHNLGKIHEQAWAEFEVNKYTDFSRPPIHTYQLRIPGSELRKNGLGKDVTNKFLGGLPGVQKEGCDGLITSAVFILHRQYNHIRTVCLEFFGADLRKAVPAIVESKNFLDKNPHVHLAGMEHLDERYVRAINYSTKAPRPHLPKMVLLIDIVGDDEKAVAEAASQVIRLANQRDAEGFVAVSPEARQRFWADRARTAAIAAHTNAFKINEDVVIPLERLAEYNEGIERINIEYSTQNKIRVIDATLNYFEDDQNQIVKSLDRQHNAENSVISVAKITAACQLLRQTRTLWQNFLDQLDAPATQIKHQLNAEVIDKIQPGDSIFRLLQRRDLRVSYRGTLARPIKEIFSGQIYEAVRLRIDDIHQRIKSSRLFVALHMHAGDGNVHTNIPVNSNDYQMLKEANDIVDRVMVLAKALGGVISGEHGIGITKIQFMESEEIEAFTRYKNHVDPLATFNRGKLLKGSGLGNAYTPSLRLVQQEALILEASELGKLNDEIKHCLRCGKCKPECNTHVPRANLLYSPRDKIMASGLLIEAFLYEEQTRRGVSTRHFRELDNIADHCTVCHKCLNPCPVDIDFGDVTILIRNLLRKHQQKRLNLGTKISMAYLNATDPATIKILHKIIIQWGFKAVNTAHAVVKYFNLLKRHQRPPVTTGKPPLTQQVIHFVRNPLPKGVPAKTTRAMLGIEDRNLIPILRNPALVDEKSESLFYFPGCGSERLFSQVGLATLAMLYQQNAQIILPPGYLCCGYPQKSTGDLKKGTQISTDNRVLFHRVATTLGYLNIKKVLVSCGTCMDQLLEYHFEDIFPGCQLLDIHEYLYEKGVSFNNHGKVKYLYHDPCHSPMKTHQPLDVVSKLTQQTVPLSNRCCGEAGTFAVARPDIATQVRFRKREELIQAIELLTDKNAAEPTQVKLLTACPACQQGLARYTTDTGLETDYIVVEMAHHLLGNNWQQQFINQVQQGGIERVLF